MKHLVIILAFFSSTFCKAQELDTFQNDSIYAKNSISMRTMHRMNGSKLQKEQVIRYNLSGQMIKRVWFWNGETEPHNIETFNYSNEGLLISVIDSFADGNIEIKTIDYQNDKLVSAVTLDLNKDTVYFCLYPSQRTTIKRWYQSAKPYRFDTTIFERQNIKLDYFGIDTADNIRWYYKFINEFDESGNLIKVSAKVESPYKTYTRYVYDKRNLLTKKEEVFLRKKKPVVAVSTYFTYE